MIRWEYRHYVFEPGDKVLDILNRLGGEGWEAFHFANGGNKVLFKRPKTNATQSPTTGEPSK